MTLSYRFVIFNVLISKKYMKILKKKKIYNFPVIIEKDESGYFIGIVPGLRGCHTQAKNLPELYKRLDEVVLLCLEVEEKFFKTEIKQNQFIGVQQFQFAK